MIIPDKYTTLEKSLIYKVMQLHNKKTNSSLTNGIYIKNKSTFKDIDEYIKVVTLMYILGIIDENKETISYDPSNK